ncbi:TPA: hypothetical protein CPT81_07480 [Candidatus Gastranaerophilales bacterium HUM_20]|nr:putative uncharacterized protein [Clostridium sp. CAG:729]DAB20081.1 MAG TPA: hypothetical protein CPT81_07480 [Candidatus Gastranaerophilales bacterium HUM_20]
MINSVSNVSFRGEVDAQALINSPGKYTTAAAPKAEAAADSFEKEGAAPKKKSKAPAIIGTIVGLAAAAYIALGIAVGKGKLAKAVPDEAGKIGFMGKVKNFFVSIGESADNLWSKIRGKKADDAAEVKPKADAPEANKPVETEPKKPAEPEVKKNENTDATKKEETQVDPKKNEGTEVTKKEETPADPKKNEGADTAKKEEAPADAKKEEGADAAKKEEAPTDAKKEEGADAVKKEGPSAETKKEEEKK